MEINVETKKLNAAMGMALAAVKSRAAIPALSGLSMKANGALTIEGTDLDTRISVDCPYEGKPGDFLLTSPRSVRAAINKAGASSVTIAAGNEGKISVKSGHLAGEFITRPQADFPGRPHDGDATFTATIDAATIAKIARVAPAISTEETRYYLNGIHIHKVEGSEWLYRAVATDGHRLMMIDIPLPDAEGALPKSFILPRRALKILFQIMPRSKDAIKFRIANSRQGNARKATLAEPDSATKATFSTMIDDMPYSLATKLIDANYPDYSRVIPQSNENYAVFKKTEIRQAVDCVMSVGYGTVKAVSLTSAGGKIIFAQKSPENGNAKFTLHTETNWKDGADIGFNGQYLLDIIGQMHGDNVRLEIGDSSGPVVFTDPEDTEFRAVLMPMRF